MSNFYLFSSPNLKKNVLQKIWSFLKSVTINQSIFSSGVLKEIDGDVQKSMKQVKSFSRSRIEPRIPIP